MKLLWVRLRSLGDVLLTLPVLQYLHQTAPGIEVTYVVHEAFRDLVGSSSCIRRVVSLDRGVRGYARAWFREQPWMRDAYDWVVDSHGGRLSSFLVRRMTARRKVGFILGKKCGWITDPIDLTEDLYWGYHTVELQARLLEPILGSRPRSQQLEAIDLSYLHAHTSGLQRLEDRIGDRILMVLHPWARYRSKRWDLEHIDTLADALIKLSSQWVLGLFLGPGESHLARHFRRFDERVILLEGLDLIESVELLRRADLYIGFDTGIMHLAAAVGTPLVILWGASYPDLWAPWRTPYIRLFGDAICVPCGKDRECPTQRAVPCIDQIPLDIILMSVRSMLGHGWRSRDACVHMNRGSVSGWRGGTNTLMCRGMDRNNDGIDAS